jgi:hypothetical protein
MGAHGSIAAWSRVTIAYARSATPRSTERKIAEPINLREAEKFLVPCRDLLVKLNKQFDFSRGLLRAHAA